MVADAEVQATVLVVDDDADLRGSLADYLSDNYAVLEAASADAAMVLLATTAVDFVVSDVRMPGTMDGFGLAAWLRANRPDTPVLLMTGYSERATHRYPDDPPLWHKPFTLEKLLDHIRRTLRSEAFSYA